MALNKGEWSEVYTFLKILADQKLCIGDMNLNKIEDVYYPVLKILHDDLEYHINSVIKVVDKTNQVLLEIDSQEFKKESIQLLSIIKSKKDATFSIPKIESFLTSINVKNLKAKSRDKKDITLVVHDFKTGLSPELGFSIKSYLGSSSTLINASQKTNFIYKIEGDFTQDNADEINTLSNSRNKPDIKGRVQSIYELNCSLKYRNHSAHQKTILK